MIPVRTIERLCVYRRILFKWLHSGKERFFSHELAEEANITAAQVRRDLMSLETIGTPANGYFTANINEEFGIIIEGGIRHKVILVGVGNLGRAILKYFLNRLPDIDIVASFDKDNIKIGSSFATCPCLKVADLKQFVAENKVRIGILTVPANAAQEKATAMAEAGITAIINFTPVKIKVPKTVFVDNIDISISLEKAAYYSRMYGQENEPPKIPGSKSSELQKGGSMKRILCIEDDRDIVESYKRILESAGYVVDIALEGESGFQKAKAEKPDLIIMDVMMTDITEGFHVTYRMRADAELKYIPILMVTSVNSASGLKFNKEKDGEFLPVDAFVEKPVAPNSLLANVKKLLDLEKEQINVEGVRRGK